MRTKFDKPWSEEEFILTLDLYFRTEPKERDSKNSKIIEIAKIIRRTPASVVYRLGNYSAVDPQSLNKGFNNHGKTVAKMFAKYSGDKETLKDLAANILNKAEKKTGISEKVVRICWNDYNWQKPSGREGKSQNKKSYEYKVGYGHEEWLLDTEKLINGYHYGYLQPIADAWEKYQGKIFNISLYSINNDSSERWWIGAVNNARVVTPDESKKAFVYYKKEGWFQEMIEQIKNVKGKEKDFLNNAPIAFTNIKFIPQDLQLLEPPQRILRSDEAIPSTYYVLLNKTKDPDLEFPLSDDPDFSPGHTPRKEKGIVSYGQRKSEVDWFHSRMQSNVYRQLVKIYGQANVRTEREIGTGAAVDLSVKAAGREIFYEFKTSNSIKKCIREALSQLLEYSYYPNKERAKKLIIVSQNPINKQAVDYLSLVRNRFNMPVYYQQYDAEGNCLIDKEY